MIIDYDHVVYLWTINTAQYKSYEHFHTIAVASLAGTNAAWLLTEGGT
mgnify:FL=1